MLMHPFWMKVIVFKKSYWTQTFELYCMYAYSNFITVLWLRILDYYFSSLPNIVVCAACAYLILLYALSESIGLCSTANYHCSLSFSISSILPFGSNAIQHPLWTWMRGGGWAGYIERQRVICFRPTPLYIALDIPPSCSLVLIHRASLTFHLSLALFPLIDRIHAVLQTLLHTSTL